jgi:antitoxin (DNA-binding transcriptional repressor) of toxin-antitoxin stability system
MKVVGIRELKDKLSEYVRIARAGESVLVTDRGEVVAELRAVTGTLPADALDPDREALRRRGGVRIGGTHDPSLYVLREPVGEPGLSARLLNEIRGER